MVYLIYSQNKRRTLFPRFLEAGAVAAALLLLKNLVGVKFLFLGGVLVESIRPLHILL